MKICEKCGAHQSDDRQTCLDCGAVLGKPLSDEEERALNEDISDSLTGMSERTEDFYVSPRDRVLGILSIVLAVLMVILINVYSVQKNALKYDLPENTVISGDMILVTDPVTGSVGMTNVHPNALSIEQLDRAMLNCLIALVCLGFSALEFLVPKVMWFLDTLRYRLWFAADPSPSDFYLITAKIVKYVIFAVGVLCAACAMTYLTGNR